MSVTIARTDNSTGALDAAAQTAVDARVNSPMAALGDGRTVATLSDWIANERVFNARNYGGGPTKSASANTAAIRIALDKAATVGGVALVTGGGAWAVDDTLAVAAGATLRMDRATTITPTTDADVVSVAMNGRLEGGGTIDYSALAVFTHAGILVEGTTAWGSASGHAPLADDIRIIGNRQTGSAGVRYTCTDGRFVSFTRMSRLSIQGCYYGIDLAPVAGTGLSYINGNIFEAHITGCVYPVHCGGGTSSTAADGNVFDVQIQSATVTQRAVYIAGSLNRVEGMLWDFGASTAGYPTAVELGASSYRNLVRLRGVDVGEARDAGVQNQIEITGALPWVNSGMILPSSLDAIAPNGNADDLLTAATSRYAVTASVTPGRDGLPALFTADPATWGTWTTAGLGSPQTVTVDLGSAVSSPVAVGVQFRNGRYATSVTLELYDGAAWQVIYATPDNRTSQILAPVSAHLGIASFSRVRLTIEGNKSGQTEIRVTRFYAFAATVAAVGFLPTTGGTVYGKVLATGGLGVGNSAAATTLGAVVRKVQVFDANGVSLGYVPVYASIT